MKRILVLDDEPGFVKNVVQGLSNRSFMAEGESESIRALERIRAFQPDAILLDLAWGDFKDRTGLSLLKEIRKNWRKSILPVFILTATGTSMDLDQALDNGANDFFTKPFEIDELAELLTRTLSEPAKACVPQTGPWKSGLIGQSEKIITLLKKIRQFAVLRQNVVFTGETGTGKSLAAAIYYHYCKKCGSGPFADIQLNAINPNLLEAELFGTKKGAFSGAVDRISLIEKADGGVVFLDEIGTLDYNSQSKLLHFLEKKEITPVGGTGLSRKVDVVVLAATNINLLQLVKEGKFREDLYGRLFDIELPALREHLEDIPIMVEHFIDEWNSESKENLDHQIRLIDPEVLELFQTLSWPRNVRELRECLREGARNAIAGHIMIKDVQGFIKQREIAPITARQSKNDQLTDMNQMLSKPKQQTPCFDMDISYKQFENKIIPAIQKAYYQYHLNKHQGKVKKAAAAMGFNHHQQLSELIRRHHLGRKEKGLNYES